MAPKNKGNQKGGNFKKIDKKPKEWSLADFEFGKLLGSGGIGDVFLAMENKSEIIVAIKVIKKVNIAGGGMDMQLKREVEIQSRLNHKNILKLYNYFYDEDNIYIILEYAPQGGLSQLLKKQGRFSEADTAKCIYQLALALDYCHKRNIIHRDVKLENILIGYEGELKLCDFGWAIQTQDQRRNTLGGTKLYWPPEMAQESIDKVCYNHTADIWSIGVLCYELLTGETPFQDNAGYKMLQEEAYDSEELNEQYDILLRTNICGLYYYFPEYVSKEAKSFIGQLLRIVPEQRLSLNEILNHPWITSKL